MKSKILVAILSLFFVTNIALAQSIASNDLNSPKAEIKKVAAPKTESPNLAKPTIDNSVKFKINNNSFNKHGINYNLKEDGFVTLRIFDYDGNEVANLVNREQKAGSHFANFSSINLSAGIYKYCVSVNDESVCQRMLFVN